MRRGGERVAGQKIEAHADRGCLMAESGEECGRSVAVGQDADARVEQVALEHGAVELKKLLI